MMTGCTSTSKEIGIAGDFQIIEVDSCEYLKALYIGGTSYFAHKGNCKYCKERREKEIEEIINELKNEIRK